MSLGDSGTGPPTVVFFNDEIGWGGTERYLYTLSTGLLRRGVPVEVVVPTPSRGEGDLATFLARFRDARVPVQVHPGPRSNIGRIPWTYLLCRRLQKRLGSNLVLHFNQSVPGAHLLEIIAARLAGVGLVVNTNHLPVLKGPTGLLRRWIAMLAKRCTDLTIVASETNREIAVANGLNDPRKTMVVVHGIELRPANEAASHPVSREELGVADAGFVIGSVGRLAPQKGFPFLIEALSITRSKHGIDADLVIVGDGPERPRLERLVDGLDLTDHVHLIGHREDVAHLLTCFDIFALASVYETISLAILEAMAAGKPVVATDVGGVCDAVVNGQTGLLVPTGDAGAMAAALAKLAREPGLRAMMGSAAARMAKESFDADRMVAETWKAYAAARRR